MPSKSRFLFCLLLLAIRAKGGVLSTLQQQQAGEDVVTYNTWQSTSFSIAEGAGSYRLRSVTLQLEQLVANANFFVRVTGSTPLGVPDNEAVIAEFAIPADLRSGAVTLPVKPDPDPLLLPGQTYWLTLGITALDNDQPLPAGLYRWKYAATNQQDSPSAQGWTLGCCSASSSTGGTNWSAAAVTPFLFSIQARPPSAVAPNSPSISLSSGVVQVNAKGTPGVEYEIFTSRDLSVWSSRGTAFANTSGLLSFTDTPSHAQLFYRFQ